jgi:hypothetical protein
MVKKMLNTIFVTVTNDEPTNQNALILLLYSLYVESDFDSSFYILYPLSNPPNQLISCFRKFEKINFLSYDIDVSDDKYKVKFLLDFLIEEKWIEKYTHLLYIDPDHIILDVNVFNSLSCKENQVLVSSEIYNIIHDCGNHLVEKMRATYLAHALTYHKNTSFIFCGLSTYKKISTIWRKIYDDIYIHTDARFREEMAFNIAMHTSQIDSVAISSHIQGNFLEYNKTAMMFHYGGDFYESKLIKSCLSNGFIDGCVDKIICFSNKSDTIGQKIFSLYRTALKEGFKLCT